MSDQDRPERADAARNRRAIMKATEELLAVHPPAQVSVERLGARYPEFTFVHGDAGDVALPAGTFDVAFMIDVTQHITDDGAFGRAMRNVWAAIKPGGAFLVTFWDPGTNKFLSTKLRLNRIEKPRGAEAYLAAFGPGATIASRTHRSSRARMICPKWPTPGRMIFEARSRPSEERVSS